MVDYARNLDHAPGRSIWTLTPSGGFPNAYRFAKLSATDGTVAACSTAGENADGVVEQDTTKAGDDIALTIDGVVFVEAGDTVADGGEVMTDNVGRAVPLLYAANGAPVYRLGKALKGGTVGNRISVRLRLTAATGLGIIRRGSAQLSGGTVVVPCPGILASDTIMVTRDAVGGTPGYISCPAASIIADTSFVINSSGGSDTSVCNWTLIR